jgi:FkbM family methyltransferase
MHSPALRKLRPVVINARAMLSLFDNHRHPPEWMSRNWVFRRLFILRKLYLSKCSSRFFSQFGEDAALPFFVGKQKSGFFVDVGCFHPRKYSNTYLLYRRGWRGINVDLDEIKIDAFKLDRSEDWNVCAAVSDTARTVECHSLGTWALFSSLEKAEAEKEARARNLQVKVRSVQTRTLDNIIFESPFREMPINLLSIDTEGHDLNVLKSISFEKYKPGIILLETHAADVEELQRAEFHQFLSDRGYRLVNWIGLTVVYVPR